VQETGGRADEPRDRFARRALAALSPALELSAAALVAALLIRVPGSDLAVHLRFVAALAAFALVGGAVESGLGLARSRWQAICLGQLSLGVWFWLRTLSCGAGLPGVGAGELWLLALLALCALLGAAWREPQASPGAPPPPRARWPARLALLFAWASLLWLFVGARSGALAPPSSDPDLHVFWARLTARAGHVAFTQAPFSALPIRYPSGFAVLNTLWSLLSGNSAVAVVDAQTAIQGSLAIGLVVELGALFAGRARPGLSLGLSLLWLAVAAFAAGWPYAGDARLLLEGTPRLAFAAMALLPLTLVARERLRARRGLTALLLLAGPLAVWALLQNPACLVAALVADGAALGLALRPVASGPSPRSLVYRRLGYHWMAGLALSLCLLGADSWVRSRLSGVSSAVVPVAVPGNAEPSAKTAGAAADVERAALPARPAPPPLDPAAESMQALAALLGLALLFAAARRPALRALAAPPQREVLGALAAGALALAVARALLAALPAAGELGFVRDYGRAGCAALASACALAAAWLAALALVESWSARAASDAESGPDAAQTRRVVQLGAATLAIAALAFVPFAPARLARTWRALFALPEGTLGAVDENDLRLAERAGTLVPAGERVLLPALPAASGRGENWIYPVATSRAAVLAGWALFAFGYAIGGEDLDAVSYRRHVCRSFDLPWLASRGIRWMLVSARSLQLGCVQGDGGGPALWEVAARDGDAALLHLRPGALERAARDGSLRALERPAATGAGARVRGAAEVSGPIGLKGWACSDSPAPASVELELFAEEGASAPAWRETRVASEPSPAGEQAGCGPNHGYAFAPVAPPGVYRARLRAWSADATASAPLADGFAIVIDY